MIASFRFWLAEEGLALVSSLKRGQWYDFDARLLHSIFDELVNFVEKELAWMQVVLSDEDRKNYKTPLLLLSRHYTVIFI